MQLLSRLKMVGILYIKVRDVASGKVIRTICKRNSITYDAGNIVRQLLSQRATDALAVELQLGSMRFGTDSTPAARTDTGLYNEISATRGQLTDDAKLDGGAGEITLHAVMESGVGNGNTYREAGLFTRGPAWDSEVGGSLMCWARQIHPAVEKSSAIALEYDWTLQFTA